MTPTEAPEVTAHFADGAQSAGPARRLVTDTLRGWGRADLADIATLLVGELVANVVLHAGTAFDLHVRRAGDGVRVEVHDASPRLPDRKHYSPTSTTGRGLLLVEELSRSWGAARTDAGKAVWFELDRAPAARSVPPIAAPVDLDGWEDLPEEPPRAPGAPDPAPTGTGPAPGRPSASGGRRRQQRPVPAKGPRMARLGRMPLAAGRLR